jgi:hypothetical protein
LENNCFILQTLYAVVAVTSFNYRWTKTKALLVVVAQNVAFSTQSETAAIILMMLTQV